MKSLTVACLTVGLAAINPTAAPGVPATAYYIRSPGNHVVGAIYTPHVWASMLSSSQQDGGLAAAGTSPQQLVRIAFREPGTPQHPEALQAPWRLALVDEYAMASWQQPEAQHPVSLAGAAIVAAQTGITELSKFTVVGEFTPAQLTGRKFVIIYHSAPMPDGGVHTEFHAERLPDPSALRWH
jgi:hypothetical protein